jgi:hypothetical protein
MLDFMRRTHDIFNGLLHKDLSLISADPPGRTDCQTFGAVPLEDLEVDVVHKHEWSHVMFKTNLHARELFVQGYAHLLEGTRGGAVAREGRELAYYATNILDDLRVLGLWSLIYPRSADQTAERWKRLLLQKGYTRDLILYLMGLELGLRAGGPWERFQPLCMEVARRVRRSGYAAVLTTTRWFLDQVLEHLLDAPARVQSPQVHLPPQDLGRRRSASQGVAGAATALAGLTPDRKRAAAPFLDQGRGVSTADPNPNVTLSQVDVALGVSTPEEATNLLEDSRLEIESLLTTLRQHTTPLNLDRLLLGRAGRTSFLDFKPEDIVPFPLPAEDRKTVGALSDRFRRLNERRRRMTAESGTDLDPQRYIDFLMGSGEGDIFLEEARTKGFNALVLADMSGSMRKHWLTLSRAAKVLALAMRLPLVKFETWGFTSTYVGETTLCRFLEPAVGLMPAEGPLYLWGLTPLHIAIPVAVRHLRTMPGGAQHLFLITDGRPQHIGVFFEDLEKQVEQSIIEARKLGVHITTLLLGAEVSDAQANLMFGKGHWERVSTGEDDLFDAMVGVVSRSFGAYLRR